MSVVTDNFTDTDGVLLQAHTSPGGETWTSVPIGADGNFEILTNQITMSAANAGLESRYRWNLADQVSDVALSLVFTFSSTTGTRHFARISSRGNALNSAVSIERLVGGADEGKFNLVLGNNFGTKLSGYDDGLPHTLKLNTTTPGVLTAYIDGVLKDTCTPGGLSSIGTVFMQIGQTGTTGGSPLFDSISVNVTMWAAGLVPNNVLGPLTNVITRVRTYIPIRAAEFWKLTGPHRIKEDYPSTHGGTSGGSSPPIEGQLWPRGQKSG